VIAHLQLPACCMSGRDGRTSGCGPEEGRILGIRKEDLDLGLASKNAQRLVCGAALPRFRRTGKIATDHPRSSIVIRLFPRRQRPSSSIRFRMAAGRWERSSPRVTLRQGLYVRTGNPFLIGLKLGLQRTAARGGIDEKAGVCLSMSRCLPHQPAIRSSNRRVSPWLWTAPRMVAAANVVVELAAHIQRVKVVSRT